MVRGRTAEEAKMAANGTGKVATAEEFLAAAGEIMVQSAYCWAMTATADGGVNARVMGRVPKLPDEDQWTVWFLVSRRSRKASEVASSGRLTVAYGTTTLTKYAVLLGRAVLVDDRAVIARHWQESWSSLFANGKHDPDIAFIQLEPDRMEVFVEGMQRYVALERDLERRWTLVPSEPSGPR
jgi:general stress protein 26